MLFGEAKGELCRVYHANPLKKLNELTEERAFALRDLATTHNTTGKNKFHRRQWNTVWVENVPESSTQTDLYDCEEVSRHRENFIIRRNIICSIFEAPDSKAVRIENGRMRGATKKYWRSSNNV